MLAERQSPFFEQSSTEKHEAEPLPHELVYFTSTFYPNPKDDHTDAQKEMAAIRQEIALESFKKVLANGHQIVIVDEGSNEGFKQRVAELGIAVSQPQEPGMGNCRRQALVEASQRPDAKYLFWVEPEKDSYVDFIQALGAQMAETGADIGMPTRDPALFEATYPDYQVASERRAAKLIDDALHDYGITQPDEHFDWFFGPKVLRNDPELVKLFTRKHQVKPDVQERMTAEKVRFREINESIDALNIRIKELNKELHLSHPLIPHQRPHVRTLVDPDKYSNVLFYPIFEGLLDLDINVVALDPIPFEYPAAQKENETNFASEEARNHHVGRRKTQLYGILTELIHFAHEKRGHKGKSILEQVA